MKAEGHPFTGFLYAGLMIDEQGEPYTVEFNCRFGDPETQPVLSRLDSDLAILVQAALNGTLNEVQAAWNPQTALGVVLAAQNYPDSPRKGDIIEGLQQAEDAGCKVFHAGTAADDAGNIVSAGGRVLCVVGLGDDVAQAKAQAYRGVDAVRFAGMQYRRDIGDKALPA